MGYTTNLDYLHLIFDRIKQYRFAQRLSQKELAAKAGVSLSFLQRIEQHRATNMTILNLILLLRALGQEERVQELLPELPIPPEIHKLISKFSRKRIKHSKYDTES